jgi:hypothetical protein
MARNISTGDIAHNPAPAPSPEPAPVEVVDGPPGATAAELLTAKVAGWVWHDGAWVRKESL